MALSLLLADEASRVWQGVKDILFGRGEELRYRPVSQMRTIGGKSNKNGARFDPIAMEVHWLGHIMRCDADWGDPYIREALNLPTAESPAPGLPDVRYCEIERKAFNDGWHYYAVAYLGGPAPHKERTLGHGAMGIDPGVSTVAAVADGRAFLRELAERSKAYSLKEADIKRRMDRSRRDSTPENFSPDGTVKHKKDLEPWRDSARYRQLRWQLRTAQRKHAACTKQSHEELANELLASADTFYVEKNDFAAMARRSKKKAERKEISVKVKKKDGTIVNVRKFKRKRRFGRSVTARAPSGFVGILKRKALMLGGTWAEIPTRTYKASQYDHTTGKCGRVPLSQRSKVIGGHEVQRDLYSAFLLKHPSPGLDVPDRESCVADFKNFVSLQDEEIAAMKAAGISMKRCFGF